MNTSKEKNKIFKPRVVVTMNTGTRKHRDVKRDSKMSRKRFKNNKYKEE